MESKKQVRWNSASKATTIAAVALAALSCTTDPYYYDPYSYYYGAGYYYPTDIAYGGAYYADDIYGAPFTYAQARSEPRETNALPGATLRSLAAGEDVCPGHVTVAKTPGNPTCPAGNREPVPASTTLQFADCELPGGTRLSGAVQIDTTFAASDADCNAETRIDVTFTSTATNLSYTAEDGARLVVPTLTLTGAYTRGLAAPPSVIELGIEGQVERYDKDGGAVAQTSVSGKQTLTPLGSTGGYRVSGSSTMRDAIDNETVRVTSDGINRPDGCCYPTSGSIEIEHSDGDLDVLRFGPDCNDVSLNSESVTPKECL